MITVHHLEHSRSQRVLWMLEELGVPYEVRRWKREADMMAPPDLRRIHPLGKSPILVDGELTLAETGLILTYLCERYGSGSLAPPGTGPAPTTPPSTASSPPGSASGTSGQGPTAPAPSGSPRRSPRPPGAPLPPPPRGVPRRR